MKGAFVKKTTLGLLLLTLSSFAFAEGRAIICDRDPESVRSIGGCLQYSITYESSSSGNFPHLNLSEFENNHKCSLMGYIDTENTPSIPPVVDFLTRKTDKLPSKIYLKGESSSSDGFNLATKSLNVVEIDMASGSGKLKYRSGKGLFNPLTGQYLFPSKHDSKRDEQLTNCREQDI